ncbi:MAG TPA: sulfite exporter TauE/SafE family protein [Bacteroidota bacterium]|jgi:hypothetical protein
MGATRQSCGTSIAKRGPSIEFLLIGAIAFAISVASGVLGLGGAVLLIPAYLYLPPVFGMEALDMKGISGMTSVQVLATSIAGMIMHRRKGAVNQSLVLAIGLPISFFSFAGAYFSRYVSSDSLLVVFAVMAVFGAILLLVHREDFLSTSAELTFSKAGAISVGSGVGILGGMVGAPGAFLLSPLMMTVLKIPTRITIGSTLGIVVLSATAASLGKILSEMVPYGYTATAVAGSVPGVLLGSILSHRFQTKTLRRALAIFIGLVGVEMCYRIFIHP